MKLNLDSDTLKEFGIAHCEKFAFVACILLVVLFIYFGYSLEGLPLCVATHLEGLMSA